MFEVVENEGWDGVYPKWFATNGEEYNQFDSEEEAQEYCDERNQQVYDEQVLKYFIEKHGRPPNTNDFFC
jgi:viroplasmin and RNaseH domain-containing protein